MPTRRAVALAAVGLAPALLTVLSSSVGGLVLAFDAALVLLVLIDGLRAPSLSSVTVAREATGSAARLESEELWRSNAETRRSAREYPDEPGHPAEPS